MPTVKHPETFQGCCSSNGVSSLTILPKITVMNKEYQNILQELFPKTQDKCADDLCILQYNGHYVTRQES